MTSPFRFILSLVLVALLASCQNAPGPTASSSPTVVWTGTERYAEWKRDGYTVRNDVWGDGHGPQTIWAISPSHWGVHADHPESGGIKAYPHSATAVNRRLSGLKRLTSRFECTVPATGSFCTAYDIWCDSSAYEIMVWMNLSGKVGPIAGGWDSAGKPIPAARHVMIGAEAWTVYNGTNGHNKVFSFVREAGNATAGELDIKALMEWIKTQGWFGDVMVGEVQFGWEITSSVGGLDFVMKDYSVTVE